MPDSPGGETHQKSAGRKRLKTALLICGGIAAMALVVPALTGVSPKQLLQGVSLDAYSNFNLAYIRSTNALERGDLPAATETLLSMPEDSPESRQVVIALFPRLLEAKDYPRAGQVLGYIAEKRPRAATEFTVTSYGAGALTYGELGRHMGKNMRLQEALAQIAENSSLATLRLKLLPQLFLAVAAEELPALEKLAVTRKGQERIIAMEAVIYAYVQAKNWESAWQWVEKLPAQRQRTGQTFVMTEYARVDPQGALGFLSTRRGTPEFQTLFAAALEGIGRKHPQELRALVQLTSTPQQRDKAISKILTEYSMPSLTELLALLDMQTDPAMRAWTLTRINPTAEMRSREAQQEFKLRMITPRLAALARQYPNLVPQHDAFLLGLISENPPVSDAFRNRCLAQIIDPVTRKKGEARGNSNTNRTGQSQGLNYSKTIVAQPVYVAE